MNLNIKSNLKMTYVHWSILLPSGYPSWFVPDLFERSKPPTVAYYNISLIKMFRKYYAYMFFATSYDIFKWDWIKKAQYVLFFSFCNKVKSYVSNIFVLACRKELRSLCCTKANLLMKFLIFLINIVFINILLKVFKVFKSIIDYSNII